MKHLLCPIVTAVVLFAARGAAEAQVVTPVPAPTIITTAPYQITKPGFYQLGADLYYAGNGSTNDAIITIAASNVTLDFGGHYISGPSGAPATKLYGVYAHEEGNLTIRNGTVAYCLVGIGLIGNGQTGSLNINQSVQNMLLSYCYYAGTLFFYSNNSEVSNNRVSFIGGSTVPALSYVAGNVTYNFQCSGDTDAIALCGGDGNAVTNNTVTNLTAADANYGIVDLSSAETSLVSGNTISKLSNTGYGILYCAFAVNNTIIGATNGIYGASKYANNLTSGCTTPFLGGTAVGYNN